MNMLPILPVLLIAATSAFAGESNVLGIDRDSPVSGQTLLVRNSHPAKLILGNKDPFETCTTEIKREVIVEKDPAQAILELISGAAGSLSLFRSVAPVAAPLRPSAAPDTPAGKLISLEQQLIVALEDLRARADKSGKDLDGVIKEIEKATKATRAFLGKKFRENQATDFETERAAVEQANKTVLDALLPYSDRSIAGLTDAYSTLLDIAKKYRVTAGADPTFLSQLAIAIEEARRSLDALSSALSKLKETGTKLDDLQQYIQRLSKPQWKYVKIFQADQNARITGSVSCANTQTKSPTLESVYFTIVFQDPPRLGVSAGVLFSTLPEERISIGPRKTASTDTGSNNSNEIQKTSIRPQVVPMSLIQVRLGKGHREKAGYRTFNFTPGIGVNPKNKEAEFFTGLSYGIGNFYLSGGAHIGKRENPGSGFSVGDRPSPALTAVPLNRTWGTGFAFALSYRIPLK